MNLQSHVFMSKVIIDEVNSLLPVQISKVPFRLGNVMADYSLLMLTHPHLSYYSMDYITDKINFYANLPAEYDLMAGNHLVSFQLGLLTHYICDFFCRAHSGKTFGNTRQHMQYEDFLDNYRRTWADQLKTRSWAVDFRPMRSGEEISSFLKEQVDAYVQREQSVEEDLTLAIENSIKILYSLAAVRLAASELVPTFETSRS